MRSSPARRAGTLLGVACLLAAAMPLAATADVIGLPDMRATTVSFGFDMSTWSLDVRDLDRYTQMAVPMAIAIPFGDRLSIDLAARPFRSHIDPAFVSSDAVTSMSDMLVRASYRLGRDAAIVVVSVGAPTGKAELEDATEIANAVFAADRRFANPVTSFGTGLVANASLAIARPVGNWAFGGGVGFSYRAEYDVSVFSDTTGVADSTVAYDPGEEINLTVGLDRNFAMGSRPAQVTADVVYTLYSDDKQGGEEVLKLGDKLFIEGRLLLPVGPIDPLMLTVRGRSRGDAEIPNAPQVEQGADADVQLTARLPMSEGLAFDITGVGRYYDPVEGVGKGNIFGVGFGLRGRAGQSAVFQPAVLFQFGKMDQINVTGVRFQFGLTLKP
jgi:hypothetical protein